MNARIPVLVAALLAGDLALALVYAGDTVLGRPSAFVTRLVNLDGEANLPTWWSSAKFLLLAALLALFAVVKIDRARPLSWLLLVPAAFCLALSLDETVGLHESLGRQTDVLLPGGAREDTAFSRTGIWMLLLGPPVLAAVILMGRLMWPYLAGRPRVVRLYVLGLVLLFGSALGLEALANLTARRTAGDALQVLTEELGEMLGQTILIRATFELLASYGLRLILAPAALPAAEPAPHPVGRWRKRSSA